MEDFKLKKYIKPQIERMLETVDIMSASYVSPTVDATIKNETLSGVIDIEDLISRIKTFVKR